MHSEWLTWGAAGLALMSMMSWSALSVSAGSTQAADDPTPRVILETTLGNVVIELDAVKAPITTKNFLTYVDAKFYDGLIFHRVIPGFMIQGGGFDPGMNEKKTLKPIKNEASNGLKNLRGTLAMARTNDPDSATAQFFINVKDNDFLNASPGNAGYAVFGKVVEGMDVVDKIVSVPTKTVQFYENVPVEPVVIKSARRITTK